MEVKNKEKEKKNGLKTILNFQSLTHSFSFLSILFFAFFSSFFFFFSHMSSTDSPDQNPNKGQYKLAYFKSIHVTHHMKVGNGNDSYVVYLIEVSFKDEEVQKGTCPPGTLHFWHRYNDFKTYASENGFYDILPKDGYLSALSLAAFSLFFLFYLFLRLLFW